MSIEKAGPELDERVGRLLGWEPTLRWGVGKPEEHSLTYYGNEWQCRDWFVRHQKEYPEHAAGMEVYSVEDWPAVSTDGNAMLRAIDAMRERGWLYELYDFTSVPSHACLLSGVVRSTRMEGESAPHAVALAICEALEAME